MVCVRITGRCFVADSKSVVYAIEVERHISVRLNSRLRPGLPLNDTHNNLSAHAHAARPLMALVRGRREGRDLRLQQSHLRLELRLARASWAFKHREYMRTTGMTRASVPEPDETMDGGGGEGAVVGGSQRMTMGCLGWLRYAASGLAMDRDQEEADGTHALEAPGRARSRKMRGLEMRGLKMRHLGSLRVNISDSWIGGRWADSRARGAGGGAGA
ncbi:hypothetical protein B0H10DRAFT_653794 [Mycena sp. CBHHK59/15]|nr:hypothetical protein B0H10DRAFT_653794 [Mycena sp. CBHHK59/15]